MAHFKQESVTHGTTALLPNGQRVGLDFVDDGLDGYLASDNGYVVNQIRAAIASHTGGWLEITQADYEEALKKKLHPDPSRKRKLQSLSAGMFRPKLDAPVDLAAVVAKPEPIKVPPAEQLRVPARPKVGKPL